MATSTEASEKVAEDMFHILTTTLVVVGPENVNAYPWLVANELAQHPKLIELVKCWANDQLIV